MQSFYLRPDTTHSDVRNGLSYATAWGSWAEMVAATSLLLAGSEVFVCGAHLYSANISIPNHFGNAQNRVLFRGDYVPDPGSIAFTTSSFFLQVSRANTIISNLAITRVFHSGSASNTAYSGVNFRTPGNAIALTFFANTGETHTDLLVFGCKFSQTSSPVAGTAAIQYFSSAAQRSTMTRLTIKDCTFTDFVTARSIIHLRSQGDSDALTRMQDVVIEGNTFIRCAGVCIEATSPGNPAARGNSAGLIIRGNIFRDILEAMAPFQATGGGIVAFGFTHSVTPGFGLNLIELNDARNVQGANGFIDLFYGSFIVQDNYGDTFYSTTIDANGILFDFDCIDCVARRNLIININGKTNQGNSGCGIMILDDCTNVSAYGNIFVNMQTGIYYGVSGVNPSSLIENNIFLNVRDMGIYISGSTPGINTATIRKNFFTGGRSGAGHRVRNQSGVNWTGENENFFYGFEAGNTGHTNGAATALGARLTIGTKNNDISMAKRPIVGSPGMDCATYLDNLVDSGLPFLPQIQTGLFKRP